MTGEGNGLPELPQRWVWTTIGEVTQSVEKVKPKKNPDTQFTYFDISSIDNQINRVVKPKTYYGSEAPSRARQLVRANDVLFSTVRTYLKNIALVPEIHDGQIASTGFSVLRGESDISPKYLFYYSLTDQFINPLSKLQRGTSYPAVRDSDVRAQPISLPPAAEQQRIVAKIEALFTQLDAGVVAMEQAQAQLQRYRQAVLKAAVEGELTREWRELHQGKLEPASALLERILEERRARWGAEQLKKMKAKDKVPRDNKWKRKYKEPALPDTMELPELSEGWVWATVDQLGAAGEQPVLTGPFGTNLGRKDFVESGVPVLTIGCLTEKGISLDKAVFVSEEKAAELVRYRLRTDDLLFSRMASVGRAGFVGKNLDGALFNYHIMRLRLDTGTLLPKYYLGYVHASTQVKDYIRKVNHGATRDGINTRQLLSMPVALPPIEEQYELVREIERRLSVADEMEKAVEQSLKRAERLRQSVLKRAFEGKLVPQEPSDEPASALLARIQAEKARREAERKARKRSRKKKSAPQLELL